MQPYVNRAREAAKAIWDYPQVGDTVRYTLSDMKRLEQEFTHTIDTQRDLDELEEYGCMVQDLEILARNGEES